MARPKRFELLTPRFVVLEAGYHAKSRNVTFDPDFNRLAVLTGTLQILQNHYQPRTFAPDLRPKFVVAADYLTGPVLASPVTEVGRSVGHPQKIVRPISARKLAAQRAKHQTACRVLSSERDYA